MPAVTFQKSVSLSVTMLAGAMLVWGRGIEETLDLVLLALAVCIGGSVALAIVLPNWGVHQSTDVLESIHVGNWRGLFLHRVALGYVSALLICLLVFAPGALANRPGLRIGLLGLALLAFAMAKPGGSAVVLAAMLAAGMALSMIRQSQTGATGMITVVLLGASLIGVAVLNADMALGLLGKDLSFTGRLPLWTLLFGFIADRPLLGYGLHAGYSSLRPFITAVFDYDWVTPHNGYLDVLIAIGSIGLLLYVVLLWRVCAALTLFALQTDGADVYRLGPILVAVFVIVMNFSEAGLLTEHALGTFLVGALVGMQGQVLPSFSRGAANPGSFDRRVRRRVRLASDLRR
jgi:O-antigen ligase